MKVPTREWFLQARGWRPIALSVLLILVLLAGFLLLGAGRSDSRQHRPQDAAEFVKFFKAGDYSHARKKVPYSKAFRRAYLHKYRKVAARHPGKLTDCTDSNACIWHGWTHRDTCASSFPNTFDSVSCRLTNKERYNVAHLLSSPYWKRRGELQNKWTLRILWCGGVGVAAFYTGGTPAAAVGPGATGCLGSFFLG